MLSNVQHELRALLAQLEAVDRRRRRTEILDQIAHARTPAQRDELRLALLAVDVERRPDWPRRRRAHHQTERIRVARVATAPRRQQRRKVDPAAGT